MVLFYFHHAGYDLSFEEIHKVTKNYSTVWPENYL